MKSGMVRRIDKMGRVTIPSEVREMLKMREGTKVELYAQGRRQLVIERLKEPWITCIGDYVKPLAVNFNCQVLIAQSDGIVVSEGNSLDLALPFKLNQKRLQDSNESVLSYLNECMCCRFHALHIQQTTDKLKSAVIVLSDNYNDPIVEQLAQTIVDFINTIIETRI